jgi:hypothetical protein
MELLENLNKTCLVSASISVRRSSEY